MTAPPSRRSETGAFREFWRAYNQLRDFAVSLQIKRGIGYKIRRGSYGQVIEPDIVDQVNQTPSTGGSVFAFKIRTVGDDVLICAKLDDGGSETGEIISVAKPYELRRSTWNGTDSTVTIGTVSNGYQKKTIKVDGNNGKIDELVTPFYATDNIIFATEFTEGVPTKNPVTGIFELVHVGTDLITWIDVNADARHWKAQYLSVQVCINGVTQYLIVQGGSPYSK